MSGRQSVTSFGEATRGEAEEARRLELSVDGDDPHSALHNGDTMLLAEVKSYQPYLRDCGGLSMINNPSSVPGPDANPAQVVRMCRVSCTLKPDGHAEWVDGGVHHTGFTTAWTPNKVTSGTGGPGPDLDFNGQREKVGGPTFAAVTARSYHPGGVNVLLGDDSARFIKNSIAGATWRELGTVAGGEVVSSDRY